MASKRFSIEAVISMIDKVSGPMGKAGRSVAGFSNKMSRQFARADISAQRINKSINRVGGRVARRSMLGVGIAAGLVAREFVQFDDAIFGATARFKAAEKPGTDMTKIMVNLRKAARKTGSETQFTATQAAQALDKFALAGFTSSESIASLRSQIDLATATGEDFMRVADISSDLLGAFGLASLKGAEKVKALKNMNALLAIATVSANVTMEDLFETLKIAAPIGKQLGIRMDDLIASTALLGSTGIKGTQAATAMKGIFTRLIKPTGEVNAGLESMGLSAKAFINRAGELRPMTEIFSIISEKTKGMTKAAKGKIFAQIFGLRAIAGAANLQKNIQGISDLMEKMGKDPQKQLSELSNFMRKSFGNQLKILGSAFQEVGFKIITAFAGPGRDALGKFAKRVQDFDPTSIINGLKAVGLVLGTILTIFKFLAPNLDVVIAGFIGFKAAMIASNIATAAFGVTAGIAFAPLLLIGAVIAGIVFEIKRLIDTWDKLTATFKNDGFLSAIARFIIGGKVTLTKDQEATLFPKTTAAGNDFVSPQSRGQVNNTTTTTNGNVDINFKNTPPGTSIKQSGNFSPNLTLNTGLEAGP